MKIIILNSGLGSRLGELTKNNPKSLVEIKNNQTIFSRAINILSKYRQNTDEFFKKKIFISFIKSLYWWKFHQYRDSQTPSYRMH